MREIFYSIIFGWAGFNRAHRGDQYHVSFLNVPLVHYKWLGIPRQLVPPRPLELAGDHLPQDEGGAHEDAPDEKQEGKGHRVETQLLGGRDGEVLEVLV